MRKAFLIFIVITLIISIISTGLVVLIDTTTPVSTATVSGE